MGVVTALEFRLYPIETAYAGMLVWDRDQAERVLNRAKELVARKLQSQSDLDAAQTWADQALVATHLVVSVMRPSTKASLTGSS